MWFVIFLVFIKPNEIIKDCEAKANRQNEIIDTMRYTGPMFFPLGLGFKIKNFPYVTWLIILASFLFYAFAQESEKYEMEYISLGAHAQVERSHDHLFYEHCQENLGNNLCERFALERGLFLERQEEIPFGALDVDASPQAMVEFARFYENFAQKLENSREDLNSLPSFPTFEAALSLLSEQTQEIRERFHLLHHENITLKSLFTAVFSHENLAHLLGNMLFLFIFGRYVEARIGHLSYLLTYMLLGSAALAAYSYLSPSPFLHVLGASANVSVVMGAFYALFFHHKLKIFFFYFAFKIAQFPVKTYMFFFFMLQEFVFSMTSADNVAYMAHAIGLVFGMGFGLAWSRAKPLPRDFLYEEELESWERAKRESNEAGLMDTALDILKYNPDNKTVIRSVVNRLAPPEADINELDLEEELLLRELIPGYLRDLYRSGEIHDFYRTVQQIPHSWSMSVCLRAFSQKELLRLIDRSIDEKRLISSVLFIQAFVERYRSSPKTYNLLKTLNSVLDHIPLTESCRYHLAKIKDLSSSEGLKVAINSRLIQER